MASLERPTIGPENSAPIYREGNQFVDALAKQLTVPESFFNVHRSADRSALGKDIQDPKTWVEAVVAKDGSGPLVAAIDVPGKIFTRFASQGEFPQNLNPNSIEGVYVSLLLGEAKLKVVRSLMPDAYATGRHLADQAIKETQRLRREFVKNPRAKDLNSLLIKNPSFGEAGQVNVTFAGVATAIIVASLILSACAPVQATKTPEPGTAAGPRLTETAEAARYTTQSRDVSADVALIKAGQAVPAAATAMPEVAGTADPRQQLVDLHEIWQDQARGIPGMENVAEPQIQSFLVTDKSGPDESVLLTQNPDTQQVYIINRYAGDTVSEKIDVRAPYYSRITMGEKGDYTEVHTYYKDGDQEVALIDWTEQGFEFIGVDGRRMLLTEITMYLGETKGGGALFSPVPSGAEFYAGLPAGSVIDMEAGTITDSNGERLWVIDQGKWAESLLPPEVKEKFKLAGVDLTQMQNAKYDKEVLRITLESGEVIVLTNTDLQKGIYLGQDNVLQYRDEANQNVIYAFDPESKTFLEASKYIQKDKSDPEKYIQVANWDELYALWAKEKMFLIPFDPENTYFPPSDKIYRNYDAPVTEIGLDEQLKYKYPFGQLPEGMVSPFRFVNFTRMQKDGIERQDNFIIISEQVFNPDDGSFSVLHFYLFEHESNGSFFEERAHDRAFLVPSFEFNQRQLNTATVYFKALLDNYEMNNITVEKNGQIPAIKKLVNQWFDSRHVPYELEWMLSKNHALLISGDYNY